MRGCATPQYAGFLAIMVGFLLQRPTLPTLVMFPFVVVIYRRLAIAEQRAVGAAFGAAWGRVRGEHAPFRPAPSPPAAASGIPRPASLGR